MARLEAARIKAVPTGIEHGTITAVSDGHPFEITTLRRDVSTDGRRATVAFTDDWKEDAARRDFTINALSADPVTGEIFDYFGGLDDLEGRHIRFIGDPLKRIAEDHLRILRFFRFHARFGRGEPDAAALDACTARANDLMALSRERIADELIKLLGMDDPSATVAIMLERGILKPVLAEIVPERLGELEALDRRRASRRPQARGTSPACRIAPTRPQHGRERRRPAAAVEQGAQASRLRRGPGPFLIAASARLSRRQGLRGRPAIARRASRGCRRPCHWTAPRCRSAAAG